MIATALNAYLARALERSPRALELCAALDGRRLKVQINGFPGALWLTVVNAKLQVTHANDVDEAPAASADVTVHGSPFGLLALASGDARGAVARGSASVDGDELRTQQFQELARLLRPDLEAAAGQLVGRIPAHLAARALELLTGWARAATDSVARNTAEYLAHESRDLVPRAEAESFLGGVDALRSRLAATEAQTTRLAERLALLSSRGGA
jgi:ubiquinone biosynthesis accessory factor UbiJ